MRADLLHVVTAISNPILWASRIRLYSDFEQHMLDSGVKLTTVECTYGEHDPQIGANPHVNYVRVRASGIHTVWIKECLLNLGIAAAAGAKIHRDDQRRRPVPEPGASSSWPATSCNSATTSTPISDRGTRTRTRWADAHVGF